MHIHVLMLQSKFELIPIIIEFFTNFQSCSKIVPKSLYYSTWCNPSKDRFILMIIGHSPSLLQCVLYYLSNSRAAPFLFSTSLSVSPRVIATGIILLVLTTDPTLPTDCYCWSLSINNSIPHLLCGSLYAEFVCTPIVILIIRVNTVYQPRLVLLQQPAPPFCCCASFCCFASIWSCVSFSGGIPFGSTRKLVPLIN